MTHRSIAFCTTCKNRTYHLRQTLPQNLADNPNALFVVLDYRSADDLLEYLQDEHAVDVDAGRLVVYSFRDAPTFRMAHAKNMAHRCAMREGADILVNLDADNLTGPGFDDFIADKFARRHDIFLYGNMIKGELPRGISGRIALTRDAFIKTSGYDEKFEGWASDDKDLHLRMRMLGYEAVEISPDHLLAIRHNDRVRFQEYPHLATAGDSFFVVSKETITTAIANRGAFGCGIVYRNFDFDNPIHLTGVPTRVFGVGMHKTATTSLHRALRTLGFDSWHWKSAHEAKAIWRGMNEKGFSTLVEQHYALSDLPMTLLYKQLDQSYPGSKFILTVRDELDWLRSVERHWHPLHNQYRMTWDTDPFSHRIHQVLYGQKYFDAEVMLSRYRRHNAEVKKYFRNARTRDLLVMDMSNGSGWSELCGFLGVDDVPATPYPREYTTEESNAASFLYQASSRAR